MRDHNHEFQDNTERKYAYEFDNVLRHYMMRTFEPWLPQGKALEMGCFHGDVTELLVPHYQHLTVIEASDKLIAKTRQRLPSNIEFIHSTFEAYETDEKYDAIFLIHTLEHLDEPATLLKKVNHWLSERGRLFLVCPNANAPSRQIAVKMGLIDYNAAVTHAEHQHGHRQTYSLDTLEHVARRGELQILSRGGIFFKALANFQFDQLLDGPIISPEYLEGCYQLGMHYPDLCASIYLICGKQYD